MPAYLGVSALHEGALGLCLMVTDLTEQRHYQELQRTQAALRESERRFREMIDALPAAIYTTDAEGRLTHFNPAAVEFSGRVPELGTDPWCVSWKLYHPDGTPLPHDECPMALALREGRVVRGVETIAERPDGTRVWFMPYPTPLRDADGRLVGGINMLLDITERKHGEQAAASLAAIVDSSDDAIISKDLNGIITSWNEGAERLFGYSAEEAIGQSITMLIPPDRRDEEPEILSRLRRGERVDHFDTIRIRKDGSRFRFPSRFRRSETAAAASSAHRRSPATSPSASRSEAALKEADRRKDEFLATLAHELRNPLAPIRNAVQILKAKGPPDPELQWGRDVIDRQVQVMARLLDDLLDVSRISRNKLELRKERVELATVVEAALETSRPLIEAGGHELTVTLPPEPIHLDADPVRLAQVFANLLNNAAKYTEEGGRIWLTAERQGSDVIVSVKDNGIGIVAEMLPRIFEIFAQSPRASTRSQGGLGIGLSLVKGLVELHGGSIEAHSEGADRGSEFVVRLPVAVATHVPATAPPKRGRRAKARDQAPHPDRGRQPGQRRQPGDALADHGARGRHGLRRRASRRSGRDVAARRGAARHRHAEAERLRGLPPHPRTAVGPGDVPRRPDRLGPGGRPPPHRRGRLRSAHGQAGGPRRPHEVAGFSVLGAGRPANQTLKLSGAAITVSHGIPVLQAARQLS